MDEGWGEIHLRLEYADEAKVSQFSATIFFVTVSSKRCNVCGVSAQTGNRYQEWLLLREDGASKKR